MYMSNEIAASTENGPTFAEPRADPVQRKAALDVLIALANTGRKGLTRLGDFSLAPARYDESRSYFAQIRAVPNTGNRGCEFRFDIHAHGENEADLELVAAEVRTSASSFLRMTGLTKISKVVRSIIDDALVVAEGAVVPVKLVALGLNPPANGLGAELTVDLEMLGDDLKVGIDRVTTRDIETMEAKLTEMVAQHLRRDKLRCLAKASRASGWIDEAALRLIDAAGLSFARALDLAADSLEPKFHFGGERGYDVTASLYWDDGVIRARIENYRKGWRLEGGMLAMKEGGLSAIMVNAWQGHHFGALVEHPFVPAEAVVTHVDHVCDDLLHIQLVIGTRLIDQGMGRPQHDDRIAR